MIDRIKLHVGDRPWELAITPDGRYLLAVNQGSNTVSFIEIFSMLEVNRVNVGNRANSILIHPNGIRAFVFNSLSNTLSVLDISNKALVTTLTIDSGPLRGFKEPMWIMTNMEPEVGLALYYKRMKIEICFRDLKSLLHIDKVMNKSQEYLDKMLAMVMLTYAVCLVVGEAIRDVQYAGVAPSDQSLLMVPEVDKSSRRFLFSGPFLLLKQRYRLDKPDLKQIVTAAVLIFAHLIFPNVRTLVQTCERKT